MADRASEFAQKDGSNPMSAELEKTFNNFHELQEDLKNAGYVSIPELPGKTIFTVSNSAGLDKRRNEL